MRYLDEIRQAAEKAQKEGDNNAAIILYCLLGLQKSGELSLLAAICQSISKWDMERIRSEQKRNSYLNN